MADLSVPIYVNGEDNLVIYSKSKMYESDSLYIMYSPVANPKTSEMTESPDTYTAYIGLTIATNADGKPTSASAYTWARIKGDIGLTGSVNFSQFEIDFATGLLMFRNEVTQTIEFSVNQNTGNLEWSYL